MEESPTRPPRSDIGDPFAGCFLSLAGGLVGSIVGTVVLLIRMLPDLSLIGLVAGFGAAFLVGVVAGLVASFPLAAVAATFRSVKTQENIWLTTTAVVAAIAAAVTPSLLISVERAP